MKNLYAMAILIAISLWSFFATAVDTFAGHGEPTPEEQRMLELINRARSDPQAEALRLGIPPGDFPSEPQPPFVFNDKLILAARNHSEDMATRDFFDSMNPDGVSANGRILDAGYPLSFAYGTDRDKNFTENIAAGFQTVDEAYEGLVKGNGRGLIFSTDSFWLTNDEAGIGIFAGGRLQKYYTQEFARDDNTLPHFGGVVFDDRNDDGIYDVGEGLGGVKIDVTRIAEEAAALVNEPDFTTTTSASGGYAIQIDAPGSFMVTASGGGLPASQTKTAEIDRVNVKIDFLLIDSLIPKAIARADVTAGRAPLTVNFDGSESFDPNDDPITHSWDFGDGSAPQNSVKATHTYAAGTYTAELTVDDEKDGAGKGQLQIISLGALSNLLKFQKAKLSIKWSKKAKKGPNVDSCKLSGTIAPDSLPQDLGGKKVSLRLGEKTFKEFVIDFKASFKSSTMKFKFNQKKGKLNITLKKLALANAFGLTDVNEAKLLPMFIRLKIGDEFDEMTVIDLNYVSKEGKAGKGKFKQK